MSLSIFCRVCRLLWTFLGWFVIFCLEGAPLHHKFVRIWWSDPCHYTCHPSNILHRYHLFMRFSLHGLRMSHHSTIRHICFLICLLFLWGSRIRCILRGGRCTQSVPPSPKYSISQVPSSPHKPPNPYTSETSHPNSAWRYSPISLFSESLEKYVLIGK